MGLWALFGNAWLAHQIQSGLQYADIDLGADSTIDVQALNGSIAFESLQVDQLNYQHKERQHIFPSPEWQ